ncbi:unnamed protein product [Mytilus coruscus]|uniref:C-type lectin domain-containing protein n=1 Tax=Mytilus coruscus TaxID=42192 RepID=A0A6J8F0I1_MYTCO|nr:unnamed protein product [Mytilus coruscus]
MLHIAFCIAFFDVTVSVVLTQTIESYTKCVQVGTTSVNKTPFLNSDCISAIDGAIMCTKVAECTVFTYDDLTKVCHLYQMIDTVNCDINEQNGGMTYTKDTDRKTQLACITVIAKLTGRGLETVAIFTKTQQQDLGMMQQLHNGNLQWTTCSQKLLSNETRWTPGEPKTEDCVQILAGKFDDTSFLHQKKFVC